MTHRRSTSMITAVLAAASLAASSCGVGDQAAPVEISGAHLPAPPSTVAGSTQRIGRQVRVYLVASSDQLVPAVRSDPVGDIGAALKDLLAGPSRAEVAAGITSAVPSGTRLSSAQLLGTTARLDFTEQLTSVTGHEELLAFAQIVTTACASPGVEQVEIYVAGQAVNAPEPNGTLAQGPVTAADYTSLLPGG